jgi:hypothetical protein
MFPWGKEEVGTGFWWGNLKEGDHLEEPGVDGHHTMMYCTLLR